MRRKKKRKNERKKRKKKKQGVRKRLNRIKGPAMEKSKRDNSKKIKNIMKTQGSLQKRLWTTS